MEVPSRVLYGGYEGSDDEVTEGAKSLGELILNKWNSSPNAVVLVSVSLCVFGKINKFFLINRVTELGIRNK